MRKLLILIWLCMAYVGFSQSVSYSVSGDSLFARYKTAIGAYRQVKVSNSPDSLNGIPADEYATWATPEMYGAIGDGLTDDTQAIRDAIRNNLGKTITFRNTYVIEDSIWIDLDGGSLTIIFQGNAKILSKFISATIASAYYSLYGSIRFTNGDKLTLQGVNIRSDHNDVDDSLSYISGIVIGTVNTVILDRVKSTNAAYSGIRVQGVTNLYMQDCIADSNLYAGILTSGVLHTVINGGEFNHNGQTPFLNGYGVFLAHPFGYGIDNADITITGVQANYNLRKGIDLHGGIGANIIGNHVKGFVYAGIYAVGEGGGQVDHKIDVRDIIVDGNIIEGDSTWVSNLDFSVYKSQYAGNDINGRAIQVGIYQDGKTPSALSGLGSFKVTNNIIKNATWYSADSSRYESLHGISFLCGTSKSMEAYNNTITNSTFRQNAIGVNTGNQYGQPRVVKISDNILNEVTVTEENAILVTAGEQIQITNNVLTDVVTTDTVNSAHIKIFDYNAGSDISGGNVSGNISTGSSVYGIYVVGADADSSDPDPIFNISNNSLLGTYSAQKIYTGFASIGVRMTGNIARTDSNSALLTGSQSYNLPDKSSFNTGTAEYSLQISGNVPLDITTLTVDADYPGGNMTFEVTVSVTSSYKNSLVYNFLATAYNNQADSISNFTTHLVRSTQLDTGVSVLDDYEPTLSWDTLLDTGTLQVSCPMPYTTYNVAIKFTGWDLIPY